MSAEFTSQRPRSASQLSDNESDAVSTPPSRRRIRVDTLAPFARWVLGLSFIYMGLAKAMDPVDFLKLVRQYKMVEDPLLLNALAAGLPWFEVCCGLLLITGTAVRGSALVLGTMLIGFNLVLVKRALAIQAVLSIPFCAVKFDCGCGAGEVFICRKLLENLGLLLLAAWLITSRNRRFCWRHSLFP